MGAQDGRLVWIDLEMTGLDCQSDSIIEIATIVTDANLEIIVEGPVLAIHQSDALGRPNRILSRAEAAKITASWGTSAISRR